VVKCNKQFINKMQLKFLLDTYEFPQAASVLSFSTEKRFNCSEINIILPQACQWKGLLQQSSRETLPCTYELQWTCFRYAVLWKHVYGGSTAWETNMKFKDWIHLTSFNCFYTLINPYSTYQRRPNFLCQRTYSKCCLHGLLQSFRNLCTFILYKQWTKLYVCVSRIFLPQEKTKLRKGNV